MKPILCPDLLDGRPDVLPDAPSVAPGLRGQMQSFFLAKYSRLMALRRRLLKQERALLAPNGQGTHEPPGTLPR